MKQQFKVIAHLSKRVMYSVYLVVQYLSLLEIVILVAWTYMRILSRCCPLEDSSSFDQPIFVLIFVFKKTKTCEIKWQINNYAYMYNNK